MLPPTETRERRHPLIDPLEQIPPVSNSHSPLQTPSCLATLLASSAAGMIALFVFFYLQYGGIPSLDQPIALLGDAVAEILLGVRAIEDFWTPTISRLSAPFGLNISDFLPLEFAQNSLRWALGQLTGSSIASANLFYFLGYFLSACLATAAFLSVGAPLGLSTLSAIAGGILYALIPYHSLRGPGHLALASYYLCPLLLWIMKSIWQPIWESPSQSLPQKPQAGRIRLTAQVGLIGLMSLLLSGSGGYYAVYSLGFCVLATLLGFWFQLPRRGLFLGIFSSLCLTLGILLQRLPVLFYHRKHGVNPEVAHRTVADLELHSGGAFSFLGPHFDHPFTWLNHWHHHYFSRYPGWGEYKWGAAIGLIAAVGMIALGCLWAFLPNPSRLKNRATALHQEQSRSLLVALTTRVVASAWLVGMSGGLATFIVLLPALPLRAHTRLAPFFALFGLLTFFLLLDYKIKRFRWVVILLILIFGILEQRRVFPQPVTSREDLKSYQDFFRELEAALPARAQIFSLPIGSFPESHYDQGIPLFFTQQLRFTGLAMRGREPLQIFNRLLALDQFETCSYPSLQADQKSAPTQLCSKAFKDFLARLQTSGYSGVLIDRALLPPSEQSSHQAWSHLIQAIQSQPRHRDGGPKITSDLQRYLYLPVSAPVTSTAPRSSQEASNPEAQKREIPK